MRYVLFVILLVFSFSCNRNGTGGDATVTLFTKHHETIIPGATVYIKYGADEFPGTSASDYDDTRISDVNGKVEFPGLLNGKYYFYGIGFDSTASLSVNGGMPLRVKSGKSQTVNLQIVE